LTPDNPTLTTYFEGEMIGNRYGFRTKNKSWGANEKIDLQHWGRFEAYKPISLASNSKERKDYYTQNFDQKEYIFMRWKEYFLVPNHRVKELTGASFDGFYYICFNQVKGEVSGIYFHSNSERWQQLELKHVPDHGMYGAMEFR
jgi:glucose-induced degradation protein 4